MISNENISLFIEDFSYLKLDDFAINYALKIKNIFNNNFDTIGIIIVIREQSKITPSFYAETYDQLITERNKYKDIGFWINENFILNNNYHFNYAKLAEILDVEYLFVKNSMEYKKENITPKTDKGFSMPQKVTIGSIITQPSSYFVKSHFNRESYKKLKIVYNTFFPKILLNKKIKKKIFIRLLNENEINTILNRFKESNKRLIKIANLDDYERCKRIAKQGHELCLRNNYFSEPTLKKIIDYAMNKECRSQ